MLREIETFLAAARHGTFTEAGLRLGLTQSAVSEQIRRLEDFVGRRLFFRTGRSATLNAAGQDLVPLADQIVALVAEMRGRHAVSAMRWTLRVGTIASLHSGLLARTMLAFHRGFPGVTLRSTRGEDDLLGQVEREELDLAVVIRPPGELPENVSWHPLLSKPFVLIAPAGLGARDWRDAITKLPLLRYDRSTVSGRQAGPDPELHCRPCIWANYNPKRRTLCPPQCHQTDTQAQVDPTCSVEDGGRTKGLYRHYGQGNRGSTDRDHRPCRQGQAQSERGTARHSKRW
ncbi:DNA-binding transcriptional regulator, LysR family [Ensifer sp. YR511]|nr:DNA-binding transcriptional regulator, LysR family [Ensifer sp. YR511]